VSRERLRRSELSTPGTSPKMMAKAAQSDADLVFLDPPYGKGLAETALAAARDGGWLAPDALIVVEEAADARFTAPDGFNEIERRRYDDTELTFLRAME